MSVEEEEETVVERGGDGSCTFPSVPLCCRGCVLRVCDVGCRTFVRCDVPVRSTAALVLCARPSRLNACVLPGVSVCVLCPKPARSALSTRTVHNCCIAGFPQAVLHAPDLSHWTHSGPHPQARVGFQSTNTKSSKPKSRPCEFILRQTSKQSAASTGFRSTPLPASARGDWEGTPH